MNESTMMEELRRDEGVRFTPYKDSLGNWTIGVGHLLGASARMTLITAAEADALLFDDIDAARGLIIMLVPNWPSLNDDRQRALLNMAFNLGDHLKTFVHFLDAVNNGAWVSAAEHMMQSLWAKQVGARALRLHDLILSEA